MIGRVVEVAEDGRRLTLFRGFLVVKQANVEVGRVALDDIGVVLANAHALSYTNNFLTALAKRGIPLVICGSNHVPVAVLWPVESHHHQSARIDAQIHATRPLSKRLWQQIVRAKIQQQASVLAAVGKPSTLVWSLVDKVRAGDPKNVEAQAAKRYWSTLFGASFRRDQDGAGINSLLNYGYAVLRAATARAVISAGLHPSIGIHHSNASNAMRLVDDLMEPFRPFVDLAVHQLSYEGLVKITPDTKRRLALIVHQDLATLQGNTPLIACLHRLTTALAQIYLGEKLLLEFPITKQNQAICSGVEHVKQSKPT